MQVPDGFAGTLQIEPCNASANADHVTLDARGVATTSACPGRGQLVTLVIVRGGQTYRIVPENVKVLRTGDGLPVRIETTIPAR